MELCAPSSDRNDPRRDETHGARRGFLRLVRNATRCCEHDARIDRVVLPMYGGDDEALNWVVACEPCELFRGPKDADWWLLSRTRYVRTPNVAVIERRLREIIAAAEAQPTDRRLTASRQASRDLMRIERRYGDLLMAPGSGAGVRAGARPPSHEANSQLRGGAGGARRPQSRLHLAWSGRAR
jgi:hypothetical protein